MRGQPALAPRDQHPRQPGQEEASDICDSASSSGGGLHEQADAAVSSRGRPLAQPGAAAGRVCKKPRPLQLPTPGSPSSSSACATPCPSPAYRCLFGPSSDRGGANVWSPAPTCNTDAADSGRVGDSHAQLLQWLAHMESKSSSSDGRATAGRLTTTTRAAPAGAGLPPPAFTILGLLN